MIDIQERLTAFAMLGATWVMWLLILLSVIGVAIIMQPHIISKSLYLRSERDVNTYLATAMVAGTVHVVIRAPNETAIKVRPTMAGLKTLAPSPP